MLETAIVIGAVYVAGAMATSFFAGFIAPLMQAEAPSLKELWAIALSWPTIVPCTIGMLLAVFLAYGAAALRWAWEKVVRRGS